MNAPRKKKIKSRSTGRTRDKAAHDAILQSALKLAEKHGYAGVTIEAIAKRAGVGKQTIYRWWPGQAEVILEALSSQVAREIREPTGHLAVDLKEQLEGSFSRLNGAGGTRELLQGLIAEAQFDRTLKVKLEQRFFGERRAVSLRTFEAANQKRPFDRGFDQKVWADIIFGFVVDRILFLPAPGDVRAAKALIKTLLASAYR